MAEAETWGGRFLDYVGLGLILTATDILVRESAIRLAVVLYLVGGVLLFVGLRWKLLRQRFASPVVQRLETIGIDPRYWMAVFAFLVICARITTVLPIFTTGSTENMPAAPFVPSASTPAAPSASAPASGPPQTLTSQPSAMEQLFRSDLRRFVLSPLDDMKEKYLGVLFTLLKT